MSGRRCLIIIINQSPNTVAQLGVKYPSVDVAALANGLAAILHAVTFSSVLLSAADSYLEEEFTDPIDAAQARVLLEIPAVVAQYEAHAVDIAAIQVVVDSIASDVWDAAENMLGAFTDTE